MYILIKKNLKKKNMLDNVEKLISTGSRKIKRSLQPCAGTIGTVRRPSAVVVVIVTTSSPAQRPCCNDGSVEWRTLRRRRRRCTYYVGGGTDPGIGGGAGRPFRRARVMHADKGGRRERTCCCSARCDRGRWPETFWFGGALHPDPSVGTRPSGGYHPSAATMMSADELEYRAERFSNNGRREPRKHE